MGLGAGHRHDRALGQHGGDAGFDSACFLVRVGGVAADEGHAALGHVGAGREVELSARAADVPRAGGLGRNLPEEVDLDAGVDGNHVVMLAHDVGGVGVGHRVGRQRGVHVDPVVEELAACGEGVGALLLVDALLLVGQLAGRVHVVVCVDKHLGVAAQVLQVRLGQLAADEVGQTADAELDAGAVGDHGDDVGGDLLVDLRRGGGGDGLHLALELDDGIDLGDVHDFVTSAHRPGQKRVDFDDDLLRDVQGRAHRRIAHVRVEEPVLVHLGHADHGHVDALDALLVEQGLVAEDHGVVVAPAAIVELAGVTREMPVLVREDLSLGIGFDAGLGGQAQRVPDVDVLEFAFASSKGLVQCDRLGVAEPVLNPVSALHHFHSFFRGCQFPLVLFCVRHQIYLPEFFEPPNGPRGMSNTEQVSPLGQRARRVFDSLCNIAPPTQSPRSAIMPRVKKQC